MNDATTEPKVTLSYFDFPGGRGEACRMALHLAGVQFHDDRIKREAWADKKPTTPFGRMPVLTIGGKGELAESNVILGFIGAGHDLLPEDNFEAAQHLAILSSVEEFSIRLFVGGGGLDEDAKKQTREEFAAGYMKDWCNNISAMIRGPFVAGDKISVADLSLYVSMNMLKSGNVDHIAADYIAAFPKFTTLYDAVHNHPGIVEFQGRV